MNQNYPLNPRLRKQRKTLLSFLALIFLISGVMLGAWQLKIVREFFGQASGVPANLIIDTQAILGPLPRPWRNLAQGGEDLRREVQGQLGQIQPGFRRGDVGVDDVADDEFHRDLGVRQAGLDRFHPRLDRAVL